MQTIFPSLFIGGVESFNCEFENCKLTVKRSPINSNTVIITGSNALAFLFAAADHIGLGTSWIDQVDIKSNTNGISIVPK